MTAWISLGISVGAFLVSAGAVVLAYRQLAQAKIAKSLPVVLDLLDDFTGRRLQRIRRRLLAEKAQSETRPVAPALIS